MKKASSRGQRGSKSIKGKHVLQICVLLGVCIWLIYQIKYSHDKKKEFYEKDGKKSTVLLSENEEDGSVKLGRKGLLPGYHNQKVNEKHVEEDEDDEEVSHEGEGKESKSKEENGNHEEDEKEEEEEEEEVVEDDEEDKNKQGEEVVEEDEEENKHEEDEIDEQDQSKTGGDTDKDDELLEEEKESGSDEKEIETNHADEIDMTVDEAREEHYKADDASSAVSNESRLLNTEKLKEISNETVQDNNSNATRSEIENQKEPDLKIEEAKTGDFVNKTTTEVKDSESSSSETKSAVTESLGDTVNGNSTEAILDASGFLQNETEIMQDRSQEDGAPPAEISNLQTVIKLEQTPNESDPNITVPANITNIDSMQDESKNSTSESSLLENISGANTTEVEENSRSEGDDESGEKESLNRISTEQTEEVDDTPETSISQEEMDILTDPQTLPDIRIEGNEEDEEEALAAERKKL